MSRVFIIQDDGKRDFTEASKFGEFVPLIGRDVFPDEAEERTDAVCRIIAQKLLSHHFRPLTDLILLTGDPVAILAAGVFLGATFPDYPIRALKYDGENKGYFEVVLKP